MVDVHLYTPPSFAPFIPDFSVDLPLPVPGPSVVRAHPPVLHPHMIGTDSEQPEPGTSSEFCEDREHRQSPHTTNYASFSQIILLPSATSHFNLINRSTNGIKYFLDIEFLQHLSFYITFKAVRLANIGIEIIADKMINDQ